MDISFLGIQFDIDRELPQAINEQLTSHLYPFMETPVFP